MNNLNKKKLEQVALELLKLDSHITDILNMAMSEERAARRHTRERSFAYAKHASWSAEGLSRAIDYIQQLRIPEAVKVLATIAESEPTDNLTPWRSTDDPNLSKLCEVGSCNHPEHQ